MSKLPIKETLISTMRDGKDILLEREVSRKIGLDFITTRGQVFRKLQELHPEFLPLVLTEAEMVTPTARRLRFSSDNGYLPPFEAGQYLNLFVETAGIVTSRPYSISSAPSQRAYYEVTVAEVADGFVSRYLVHEAEVGDRFVANGPAGVFHDNPVYHRPHKVFIAGGSGATPFISMIREAVATGKSMRMTLFYGVRTIDAAFYHEELASYARSVPWFSYIPVLSDEKREGFESGFITKELLVRTLSDTKDCMFYLCGPEVMQRFCRCELDSLEIPARRIRRELFGARRDIEHEAGWPVQLSGDEEFSVEVGGRRIPAKARESLLVALERAGIRVNVCCRSGECSFCRVKLEEGSVYTAPGTLLRYTDTKFGYIHSCKAYPVSNLKITL